MEIGVDSFVAATVDAAGRAVDPARHLSELLEAITLADGVGLDVFGIGEHHRREFLDSAPTVILAAAAARTRRIRLTSAVTVLSAADPVRVFQQFATLDLLSNGRAEIVAGRGSFIEAFPALRAGARGLRFALCRETRSASEHPREHARSLVGQTPRSTHRAGSLSAPAAEPAAGLARCRRHAQLFYSRRHSRAPTNGRHHRRRTTPFSAIDRALP